MERLTRGISIAAADVLRQGAGDLPERVDRDHSNQTKAISRIMRQTTRGKDKPSPNNFGTPRGELEA
jgi:hypothetical protein